MRLNDKEIKIIKSTVGEYFDDAKIYLFGSRILGNKKGGDIDLYILASRNDYKVKLEVSARLERRLGKPVDIVLHRDFDRPIERRALRGVEL
ncbi:nucleotidyltransferase domain-containing protein [Nitratifractor sp.]|uniref:nucleotidyltransferase domain-containing protein n=1 Tax=Nitratifractor sp. TaxID=2268144 RepID=UPI0025F2B8DD|nr:nucleotidyltransferase domain-containing protein [Nitratifractor sp.]